MPLLAIAALLFSVPAILRALEARTGGLRARFRRESARLLADAAATPTLLVTEQDLAALPALVAGYLRRAGVLGRPRVICAHAHFSCTMRNGRTAPWMTAHVEQVNSFAPKARLFYMAAKRGGVPFSVFHRYVGSEARMTVQLASVFPIIDAGGPTMTLSETVTLFNDMCVLAPATLIDDAITWRSMSDSQVHATFSNAGHRIEAVLSFDANGDLVNFRSDDRHQFDGKTDRVLPWLTPIGEYRDFGVARLASEGEAHWLEAEEEWSYGRFTLQQITYNS